MKKNDTWENINTHRNKSLFTDLASIVVSMLDLNNIEKEHIFISLTVRIDKFLPKYTL